MAAEAEPLAQGSTDRATLFCSILMSSLSSPLTGPKLALSSARARALLRIKAVVHPGTKASWASRASHLLDGVFERLMGRLRNTAHSIPVSLRSENGATAWFGEFGRKT